MTETASDSNKPDSFVPLHCHSYYSILDGLPSPDSIAERAKELGHTAVALTDHGSCGGLFQFNKSCKKHGVKAILGSEMYIVNDIQIQDKDEKPNHITLWAKTSVGYRNLMRLSSISHARGFYSKPRIDWSLLQEHKEGLMVGSACINGIVCGPMKHYGENAAETAASKAKEIFGDDFYIEIMAHQYLPGFEEYQASSFKVMKDVLVLANRLKIKTIFTYDSHYCRPSDAFYHDVLLSIQTGNTIKNPKRFTMHSNNFYMKPMSDIMAFCSRRPELVLNTLEVAEKVEKNIIETRPFSELLPKFTIPNGVESEVEYLKILIREGMIFKKIAGVDIYEKRFQWEFDTIVACNYVRYFLVLWDFVTYAKRAGVRVGPGRGSGAASLCLFCLGITHLDPIKHDLMFERFLNKERVSPPDVDIDFDDVRRVEMFKYIEAKYGRDFTTRIGTYGSLGAKDAIKRAGKALDIGEDWEISGGDDKKWKSGPKTLTIVDAISKAFKVDKPGITIEEALEANDELKVYQDRFPQLFEVAKNIEGTVSSEGVHAAGAAISCLPITDYVPLRLSKGTVCTQFDMKEVESIGLLKYDFLGLQTMRIIDHCLKLRQRRDGKPEIDINLIPLDDQKAFKILNDGNVSGIFQFESGNAADGTIGKLLRDIHVDTFDDMVVGVALFRPGTPKRLRKDYCSYKHKEQEVDYLHPMMEHLIGETFGIMIFQEQVMKVSMHMAGFSGSDADYLRKGIGKKDMKIIADLKPKFIDGCVSKGISLSIAEKLFGLCELFGGYGFNKAHSAAYALIGYQTAWLKAHYPLEFMSALMSANVDDDEKRAWYEKDCEKKMGIKVLPVHINNSKLDYSIEGDCIRRPLLCLKGVGAKAVENIVSYQPFNDFLDFVGRVDGRVVTKAVFQTIAMSGAMDSFGMSRKALVEEYDQSKDKAKKFHQQNKKKLAVFGDVDLFGCEV